MTYFPSLAGRIEKEYLARLWARKLPVTVHLLLHLFDKQTSTFSRRGETNIPCFWVNENIILQSRECFKYETNSCRHSFCVISRTFMTLTDGQIKFQICSSSFLPLSNCMLCAHYFLPPKLKTRLNVGYYMKIDQEIVFLHPLLVQISWSSLCSSALTLQMKAKLCATNLSSSRNSFDISK